MVRSYGGSVAAPDRATRAVLRSVEPGNSVDCARCGQQIKFSARTKPRQVIANVYESGTWRRVEHFHELCYDEAGSPYGEPAPVEWRS